MASRMVVVVVAVMCVVAGRAEAKEDRHDVGGLSFALPAGWKLEQAPGADHASLTHAGKTAYCIVSLYVPRGAGGDLGAELATEWKAVAGPLAGTPFTAHTRQVAGRAVAEASDRTTISGTAVLERVVVVDGKGQIATLVVLTADAASARSYAKDIDGIIASLRFPAAAPTPAAAPAPTPAAGAAAPAANGVIGTLASTVTIPDLAGTWDFGAGTVTSYVDRASGNHAGTDTVFYGELYTINANGTFTYKFTGRANNHTVREQDSGTVSIGPSATLILKFKGSRGEKHRRIVGLVIQPDRTAVMSTVDVTNHAGQPDYPVDLAACTISKGVPWCPNDEEWVRKPK